jgi:hypothetical protein
MMHENYRLLYADEAIKQFNISRSSQQLTGDQVYVQIYRNLSASPHALDSYITNITDQRRLTLYAWVDLNTLEKLASLNEVTGVSSIPPLVFASTPKGVNTPFVTTGSAGIQDNRSSVVQPSSTAPITSNPLSSPAAPVSLLSTLAAITGAGMIAVFRKIP